MPLLRFGTFELDVRTGELRKAGSLLSLPPQPFKILALLASHPGELITRDEIQRQIWNGDTFVDFEQGLNFAVNKIRTTLGDNADTPRYIETLPRRGYRFIAPVHVSAVDGSSPKIAVADEISKPHLEGIRHAPIGRRVAMYVAVLATAAIAGILLWVLKPNPRPKPPPVSRLVVALPSETTLNLDPISLAISPDGAYLVYAALHGGTSQLYLRPLDQLESKLIPGSEGGQHPFFSPNSQWLGFFADGEVKKVAVSGGPPVVLCEASAGRGGSWSDDGTVVFAPEPRGGLQLVSAAGGRPKAVAAPDPSKGESSFRWPQLLPGGNEVLFSVLGTTKADVRIMVQSLKTGDRKVLVRGNDVNGMGRYVATGHLVYSHNGTLMVAPFDTRRLEFTGTPVAVVEGVAERVSSGFSFSRSGTLVYAPQGSIGWSRTLVWVDRKGASYPFTVAPQRYGVPRLSPDGQRLAVCSDYDIWVDDIPRETFTRLTFGGNSCFPVWASDGKRVAFSSNRDGPWSLFWKAADGSGPEELLMGSEHSAVPHAWSPDGQLLAFVEEHAPSGRAIGVLPVVGQRKPRSFIQPPFLHIEPTFSPDGRWVAYVSNESGHYEIYVQPFPSLSGKWQVSTEGGREPVWARNPRELFYRNGGKMMVVDVATQPSFHAGKPRILFEGHYVADTIRLRNYDVTPDGQRFVMIKPSEQELAATQINVVLNWFEDLKQRVGPAGKQ